jgi:hypothetical protein
MRKCLTRKELSLETRLRIVKCYIRSRLLYASETWTLNKNMTKRLSAFEMWVYRRLLKISWKDKIKNEDVLDKVNK